MPSQRASFSKSGSTVADETTQPTFPEQELTVISPPILALKDVDNLPRFEASELLQRYILDRVPECESIGALPVPKGHSASQLFPSASGKSIADGFTGGFVDIGAAMQSIGYDLVSPGQKLPGYAEVYLGYGDDENPTHIARGRTNMRREVVSAVSYVPVGEGALVSHKPGKFSCVWARPKTTTAVVA